MSAPQEEGETNEVIDDPDLEAALDEADREPGEDSAAVWHAMDAMIEAIGRAVA